MYFIRFAAVKLTVLFQMKPMKIRVGENGVSLESSHGIPKQSEIQLMWLKSYV
jgi:hypothetical protein